MLACQPKLAHRPHASEGWSGRRGSNPRPTAWKAVTLPLSYSRLRGSLLPRTRRYGGQARLRVHFNTAHHTTNSWPASRSSLAARPCSARRFPRAKAGGEGRTRTFEGAWPTDLQSAAFDRFATSPMRCMDFLLLRRLEPSHRNPRSHQALRREKAVELAKGFEPPTS